MTSFITQFRKAKASKMRLIYDQINERYLITHKTHWQTWPKHSLIIKF